MSVIVLTATDATGAPLVGLTPTWPAWLAAATGADATPPEWVDIGGGRYAVIDPPAGECGFLYFGATARRRYAFIPSATHTTFAAFGLDGAPLAGLTPPWLSYGALTTDAPATPPGAPVHLGSGIYRVDGLTDGLGGTLDLGATARPRLVTIGEEEAAGGPTDVTAPVVSNVSPAEGAALGRNTRLGLRLTDSGGFRRVILAAKFAATGAYEMIHDGVEFGDFYVGSTRTVVADGWDFDLLRRDGWRSARELRAFAIDMSGNEVAP